MTTPWRAAAAALALPAQELAHRLAGQCAVLDPVVEPRLVDAKLDRVAQRVVDAELLDETSVARAAPIGGHDAVEGTFLLPARVSLIVTAIDLCFLRNGLANLTGGTPLSSAQRRGGRGIARAGAGLQWCFRCPDPGSSAFRCSPPPRPRSVSARRDAPAAAGERRLTIFYTAEIHGTPEPCGCTSDPLGDVARYAALVRDGARAPARCCWSTRVACRSPRAARPRRSRRTRRGRRSSARRWADIGPPFAAGLAETDVIGHRGGGAAGARSRQPARCAGVDVVGSKTVGGVRIGVLGVADPALAAGLGGTGDDPLGRRQARGGRASFEGRRAGDRARARREAARPADRARRRRRPGRARPSGRQRDGARREGRRRLPRRVRRRAAARRPDRHRAGAARARSSTGAGPEAAALRRVEIDQTRRAPRQGARGVGGRAQRAATAGSSPASGASATACSPSARKLDAPWTPPEGSYFTNRLIPLRRSLAARSEDRRGDAQAGRADRGDQPEEREAAAAARARARVLTSATPSARACHKTRGRVLEEDRARVGVEDARRRRQAERLQVRQLPRDRLRRGRRQQPRPHRSAPRTCSARSATVPDRRTSPRREPRIRRRCTGRRPRAPARPATPSSTPTRSSTRPTCATSSGPGHGAEARKKLGDGPSGHTLRTAALARAKTAGREAQKRSDCASQTALRRRRAAPVSSWSSRSGSMLPPLISTTVRRPRIALASSSNAASVGAADASHRMPSVR